MTRWAWLGCLLLGFTLSTGCGQKGATTAPGKQTDGGGGITDKKDTKPKNGGSEQAEDQDIAKEIEKLGGKITRDDKGAKPIVSVSLAGKQGALKEAVPHMKKLGKLRELDLTNTNVTDTALKDLSELGTLEVVILDDNGVSGSGIKNLAGAKSLKRLSLKNNGLPNDELGAFASLPQLQSLDLSNNPISNAGAKELHALKNLTELNLVGTKVNEKGVEELKKAIPKVQVKN